MKRCFENWKKTLLALLLSLTLIVGCGGGGGDDDPEPPLDKTAVRLFHLSPTDLKYDVHIPDTEVSFLSYEKVLPYQYTDDEEFAVGYYVPGSTEGPEYKKELVGGENKNYSVFLMGDELVEEDSFVVLEDRQKTNDGKAWVRFIQAVSNVGEMETVDLSYTPANGPDPLFGEIVYKNKVQMEEYKELEPGEYNFQFKIHGAAGGPEIESGNVLIVEDEVYTIVAYGSLRNELDYKPVLKVYRDSGEGDTESSGYVQIIHSAAASERVDIWLNENKDSSYALNFKDSTSYILIKDGLNNIQVGNILNEDINFRGGDYHTLFIYNDAKEDLTTLTLQDDLSNPGLNKAHIRFINTVPDLPAFDIDDTSGADPVSWAENVNLGDVRNEFMAIDSGRYRYEVKDTGPNVTDPIPVKNSGKVFNEDTIYTFCLNGFLNPQGAEPVPDVEIYVHTK